MQKLILKNVLISILLVAVFFGVAGEVRAEDNFEVGLQTPFAKSPDQFETPIACPKDEEGYYSSGGLADTGEVDENGNIWFCAEGSVRWQQVVSGDDGNAILENYAALIYKWLAGFIGIVAVLMLVVGGIQISTAGANQEGLQGGKDRIIAALLGLMLLFLASLILYTINPTFFGSEEVVTTGSGSGSSVPPMDQLVWPD